MIPRGLEAVLKAQFRPLPAVTLLGLRQVGKTTLAPLLDRDAQGAKRPDYLELESPAELDKLDDAAGYLRGRHDRLVIIDELQRAPGLFQVLRGVIDERVMSGEPAAHFLLLDSRAQISIS